MPEKKTITQYEVRFLIYHYNTGRADNGHRKKKVTFDDQNAAIALARRMQRVIRAVETLSARDRPEDWKRSEAAGKMLRKLAEEYGGASDGYLEQVYGVFKVISEEECVWNPRSESRANPVPSNDFPIRRATRN